MTVIRTFNRMGCRAAICLAMVGAIATPWQSAKATSASPHPYTVEQPDGSRITLYMRGNPAYRWEEDSEGFTVLRRNGRYLYARRGLSGRLEATGHEVGKINPRAVGLIRRARASAAVRAALRANGPAAAESGPAFAPQAVVTQGTLKNLVVLIRFADHTTRTQPAIDALDSLFNATSFTSDAPAPAGSLRMVYEQNSYGQLTIDSTVFAWVTVPNTEAYYANGNSGLTTRIHEALRSALDLVDQDVDFSEFDGDGDGNIDAITFLHSGYGAEWGGNDSFGTNSANRIWSHKWSLSNGSWTSDEGVRVDPYHISPAVWGTSGSSIGRVGVIAHETGHFLGLPDLYDTNQGFGDGIGSWGLMANSWGFAGNQRCIPHFSAWSKIRLGWSVPTVLNASGDYDIDQVETNNQIIRIDHNYPDGEYLLVENRQPAGTETCMPQGGLIVYHIDDQTGYNTQGYPGQSGWPENGNHYRIAILQADGRYNLEKGNNRGDSGDAYRAGGNDVLDGSTLPNTDSYQEGNVFATNNALSAITESGESMSFVYNNGLTPPNAGFSFLTDGLKANFTDGSSDSDGFITSRSWDFNDGHGSAVENPSHTYAGAGSYAVTLTVIDNDGNTDSVTKTVTVEADEVNQAPVLASIGNRSIAEGALLSFAAVASDPDLPANQLTFSLDAGEPGGATITPGGVFSWTPDEEQGPGSFPVTVRVTDNGVPPRDDFETITLTVAENNQAPELTSIGSKTVDEGTLLTFTATATDDDAPANILTFSLDAGAPAGASITAEGVFTWTPTVVQGPGSFPVTVRVIDNGDPARDDFETITITVNDGELPPGVVDFSAHTILGYAGSQDAEPTRFSIEDNGATLHLTGNNWKAIELTVPFDVTANSVLAFDFKSLGVQGEINAIGLTNNLASLDEDAAFALYGTQLWGNRASFGYGGTGESQHYVIPIGAHYAAGQRIYLFFANDADAGQDTSVFFSNVRLQESEPEAEVEVTVDFTAQAVQSYAGNQDGDPTQFSVEDSGQTLHLTGNNWKAIQLTVPFNVTPASVIEFDFKSDGAEGEVNAIGLTNNIADLDVDAAFAIHGTQLLGNRSSYGYNAAGEYQHYVIPIGAHYEPGQRIYVFFANDADAGQDTSVFFRNVTLRTSEPPVVGDLPVDFSAQPVLTYAGSQDRDPTQFAVEDAGATLHLTGNNWKAIQLTVPFAVTPNSVIELDFKSDGAEGEINAIGLTNNIAGLDEAAAFALHGTQLWGNQAVYGYSGEGAYVHYEIPIGAHYEAGQRIYLFFANDADAGQDTSVYFSNVTLRAQ